MSKLEKIKTTVENGKAAIISGMVQDALDAGENPNDIINVMIDALKVVGKNFSAGKIFIPEMLMASKAMSRSMEVLTPFLFRDTSEKLGVCVIGTVEGDLHDIGKKLVSIMLQGAGFTVIDIGEDVRPSEFVNAVKTHKDVKIVACSSLLSTTKEALRSTVDALRSSNLKGIKILVGGAPVTQAFADEIGADAYARDAGHAALTARRLVLHKNVSSASAA